METKPTADVRLTDLLGELTPKTDMPEGAYPATSVPILTGPREARVSYLEQRPSEQSSSPGYIDLAGDAD